MRSFLFLAVAILWCAPVRAGHYLDQALNPYIKDEFKLLDRYAVSISDILTSVRGVNELTEGQLKELEILYERGSEKLSAAPVALDAELTRVLDVIQSEASRDLFQLKQEFQAEFSKITGNSELKSAEEGEGADDFLRRIDGTIWPLIRARIIENGSVLDPVVELFEIMGASTRLSFQNLMLSQAFAVIEYRKEEKEKTPQEDRNFLVPRISLPNYMTLNELLSEGIKTTQTLFPELPEFHMESIRDEQGKLISKPIDAFIESFRSPRNRYLDRTHGQRIGFVTLMLEETVRVIEQYRRAAFPFMDAKEQSLVMTTALTNTPGNAECFALAAGVERSDVLEGPPCNPKAFKTQLEDYIAYYGQGVGYGLHESLMGYFEAGQVGDLRELKKTVDEFVEGTHFIVDLKEKWKKTSESIFNDPELPKLVGNGLALHIFLAQKLNENGIHPMLGHHAENTITTLAAVDVLKGFNAKKLDQIEKIERITVGSSCEEVTDPAKAPHIVRTKRFLPLDPEKGKWTSSRPSTAHFERILWHHEVEVGNAALVQNTHEKQKTLAGLIRWTALSRMMANSVLAQGIMGRMPEENSPKAFGIPILEAEVDRLIAKPTNYNLPTIQDAEKGMRVDWEPVMAGYREAYDKMLETFKEKNAQFFNDATPREMLEAAFKVRYRQEMALGARMMRKWKAEAKDFDYIKAARQSPNRLCRLFGLPPEHCPKEMEAQLKASLINYFYPKIAERYYYRTNPRPEHESVRDYQRRMWNLIQNREMTPDEFLDEMGAAKGVRWQPGGVENLTDREIYAIKYYTDLCGGEEMYLRFVREISLFQRLYDEVRSSYARKKAFLDDAVAMSEHLFPPLNEKVDFGSGPVLAYQVYDGSGAQFDLIMDTYIKNLSKQMVRIQTIHDEHAMADHRGVHPFLKEFVRHDGLMNMVLRHFPDQKQTLCEIKSVLFVEDIAKAVIETGFAVAMMALGPAGWLISGGILCTLSVLRANDAGIYAENAREITNALGTQVNYYQGISNRESVDAAEFYAMQMRILAALEVATFAASGVFKFGRNLTKNLTIIARVPQGLGRGFLAMIRPTRIVLARPEGVLKWWTRLPGRLSRMFTSGRDYAAVIRPMRRWGLIDKWANLTLRQRMSTTVEWLHKVRLGWLSKPYQFMGWVKDTLLDLPVSLLTGNRLSIGRGFIPQAAMMYWTAGGVRMVHDHIVSGVYTLPTEVMWDRVRSNPQEYGDLWQLVLEGRINQDQMIAIILADDELSVPYLKELGAAVTLLGEDPSQRDAVLSKLRKMHQQVVDDLKEARANPEREGLYSDVLELTRLKAKRVATENGFDSEVWGLQKLDRRLKGLIWRIEKNE